MYSSVGDNFDHAVSYPWVTYLFTGMTPDEVQKPATVSHTYWANYGRYAEETCTSPIEQPGQSGVLSVSFVTGLTFTDELLDLYHTLMANGIDVYIVSASPIDTVLAASKVMGYDVPEDHIFAMRNKLDENGVYINEYNHPRPSVRQMQSLYSRVATRILVNCVRARSRSCSARPKKFWFVRQAKFRETYHVIGKSVSKRGRRKSVPFHVGV